MAVPVARRPWRRRRDHPWLVAVPVIGKNQDGSWDRRLVCNRLEQAEAANAKAAETPAVGRIAAVPETVSIDTAWMPVD